MEEATRHTTRRGRRPLSELYARLATQPSSDAKQRAIARFVLDAAERQSETALRRCGDGIFLLALLAANARRRALAEKLIGGPLARPARPSDDTGLLTSVEANLVRAFWEYAARLRDDPPAPRQRFFGPRGRVRVEPFLLDNGYARGDIAALFKSGYRFFNDLRACRDKPPVFRNLPAFVLLMDVPDEWRTQPEPEARDGRRSQRGESLGAVSGLGVVVTGIRVFAVLTLIAALMLLWWLTRARDGADSRAGVQRATPTIVAMSREARRLARLRLAGLPRPSQSAGDEAGEVRDRTTAHRAVPIVLDGESRYLLGWEDGHWQIADREGNVEFSAPDHLRLPVPVYGGTSGDLDGDGIDELAIYSSTSYEGQAHTKAGIWLFARSGAGWAAFDWLPAHRGEPDDAYCEHIRKLQHESESVEISLALRQARRKCQSEITRIAIRNQSVHTTLLHYGREYLISQCWEWGCESPTPKFTPDADILSADEVSALEGSEELRVFGTGPWLEDSEYAYSLVIQGAHGLMRVWPMGGRTRAVPLEDRWLAVLVTPPDPRDALPVGSADWANQRDGAKLRIVAATAAGKLIERPGGMARVAG